VAGQVGQGDRPTPGGRQRGRGRQVLGQRVVQADDALLGQVGQEQPGEHLGDGADLEEGAGPGGVGADGPDVTVAGDRFPAAGLVPDHQADAPPGPHRPLGQTLDQIHVLLLAATTAASWPPPSFFTVIVWRDQAEHAAQSLAKGSRVVVVGRLQ
jgi:hypothetical protein